jgi:hypothetical protein
MRNEIGEDEGQSSGHKLNINDDITNEIILSGISSVILLVKMLCHHMISIFLKSHYNTIFNSLSIYWINFLINIFTDILYYQVNFVDKQKFFINISIYIYQFSSTRYFEFIKLFIYDMMLEFSSVLFK